jgi:hypothetical protein
VFVAAQGSSNAGLQLQVAPSVVIHYGIRTTAAGADLTYDVNFDVTGLQGNRNAIGQYINALQASHGTQAFSDTIAVLVSQSNLATYSDLLTQLGPEFYADQQAYLVSGVQDFARELQDCGTYDATSYTDSQGCVWVRGDYGDLSRDLYEGSPATSQILRHYSQGFQQHDGSWNWGLAASYGGGTSSGDNGDWSGNADTVQVGARLGRELDDGFALGGNLTLGTSQQDITRHFDVTTPVWVNGSRKVQTVAAVFDVSRPVAFGSLRLLPQLDVGASALSGSSAHEWGAGAQDLVIAADTNVHEWIAPSLGLDDSLELSHRSALHAFARVGAMTFLGQTSAVTHAGLEGAPDGTPDMRVTAEMGRTALTAEGGLALSAADFTLSLSYDIEHANSRQDGTSSLQIVIPVN